MVSAALIVVKNFDYTAGEDIAGQNGGSGFGGAWTGSNSFDANATNLTFGSLDTSGGSSFRPDRSGNGAIGRMISTTAQTALLTAPTTWFSVLVNPNAGGAPGDTTISGGNGFPLNSHGTLLFGDTAFTSGSGTSAPGLPAGSNGFGVGFDGISNSQQDILIQGVVYDDGVLTNSTGTAGILPDGPTGVQTTLIVGRIDWDLGGSDDQLTLYNFGVDDDQLPTAFATISADFTQADFNIISIGDAQTAVFDEIRFGTELSSVLPGINLVPEPSSSALLGLSALGFILRRRRV